MNQSNVIKLWNEHKHFIIMILNMIVLIYTCYQMYQVGFYNGQIQQCTDLGMQRYVVKEIGENATIKCLSKQDISTYEQYDQQGYKQNMFVFNQSP